MEIKRRVGFFLEEAPLFRQVRVREAGLGEIEVEALRLEEIYHYILKETGQER